MQPRYQDGNVVTRCPDCKGAITTYHSSDASKSYGSFYIDRKHVYDNLQFMRVLYVMFKCAGCGRGGLAKIHDNGNVRAGKLEWFTPTSIEHAYLPKGVPDGVSAEFREAELCASIGAWRAGSGLLRSTLEKLLRSNGYDKGTLAGRIDEASEDGVITEARRKRAHEEVRVLGNDVLHDEWRKVTQEEFELAHHYVQRIAEDFYDDRESVESVLRAKKRISEARLE